MPPKHGVQTCTEICNDAAKAMEVDNGPNPVRTIPRWKEWREQKCRDAMGASETPRQMKEPK